MAEFLHYWWECTKTGVGLGYGAFEWVEAWTILVGAFFLCHRKLRKHRDTLEEHAMKAAFYIFLAAFVVSTVFIAPFVEHEKASDGLASAAAKNSKLQAQLDNQSPKLDGYLNQVAFAGEPGTDNALLFIQVSIENSGGAATTADDFKLKLLMPNKDSTNAEALDFPDEYTNIFIFSNKRYLIDLKRSQLISEKTINNRLEPGDERRGWIAFRLNNDMAINYRETNMVLSFVDVRGSEISVTNALMKPEATPKNLAGSENIMFPLIETNTGWMPPELPPGCSNVVIFFGANGHNYSRLAAEMSPDATGTRFAITDLPDYFLQNLDKTPGYSWRDKYLWMRQTALISEGGKTFPYPIQPYVVSNRLYVEVQVPFLNEKRKIVMSDSFDSDLPIPPLWDRNFSTNYDSLGNGVYAYEVVNELKNPVLQVVYTAPNVVHINGIFKVDTDTILASFGQWPQFWVFTNKALYFKINQQATNSLDVQTFSDIPTIPTNATIGEIGEIFTNEFYKPIFPGQRAAFKYPFNRNLGVFADWMLETNKSDTNIIDKAQ